MKELGMMRDFVESYPKWDQGCLMYIDYMDGIPGTTGLYPGGWEETARRGDVLGNIYVDRKMRFAIYRVTHRDDNAGKFAAWLLEFQEWVEKQSALGLAPKFGDVPLRERVYAEKGRLTNDRGSCTGIYAVEMVAEFTKIYEVNDNGEN